MPVTDAALDDEASASPEETEIHDGSSWAARYYDGYLAETLSGDMSTARDVYEEIVARAGAESPEITARAALRLAALEALAGRRRQAVELVARASVLGRDRIEIVEQADRLQARLGSLRSSGSEVRGPPIGTELELTAPEVKERFARAEELLAAYHQVRLKPRLEQIRADVRAKENAMDAAVRAYRQVSAVDEMPAAAAAEFRIASLYHDLALSLMFDLPPELEPRAAARLKGSLRASAIGHLRRARTAYRRSLELAQSAESDASAADERWVAAATNGLRSVLDLLGGVE